MLLYTMNDNEIRAEIKKDWKYLTDELEYRMNIVKNRLLKYNRKKFPICVKYKFTTHNNNNGYLVFFATSTRKDISVHCTIYFLMGNALGKNKVIEVRTPDCLLIDTISIFSSHFFDRYVERLKLSVKGLSAIEHFITHCHSTTYHYANGEVFEPYPFGVGLGTYNDTDKTMLFINTFINYDLLYDKQRVIAEIIEQKYTPPIKVQTIL